MSIPLDQALGILRSREDTLRETGVVRAAVFGSTARGDTRPDSDLDILIEIAPDKARGLFGLIALQNDVKDLFDCAVDVIPLDGVKPKFLARITPEMVCAF